MTAWFTPLIISIHLHQSLRISGSLVVGEVLSVSNSSVTAQHCPLSAVHVGESPIISAPYGDRVSPFPPSSLHPFLGLRMVQHVLHSQYVSYDLFTGNSIEYGKNHDILSHLILTHGDRRLKAVA